MPNEKKITPQLREQVMELRTQGHTYVKIGMLTDTSAFMVAEICRQALPLNTKQGMTDLWILWDNLNHRYGGKKNV